MRLRIVVVLAAFVAMVSFGVALPAGALVSTKHGYVGSLRASIAQHRNVTWQWQDLSFQHRTQSSYHEKWAKGQKYLKWLDGLWRKRLLAARKLAQNPPHLRQWLCIHGYEGSWTDPNPPYWGGLQMDINFQSAYGSQLLRSKGTADHWTPLEQMWVAERAYSSGRGFGPWPNTARYCGLL